MSKNSLLVVVVNGSSLLLAVPMSKNSLLLLLVNGSSLLLVVPIGKNFLLQLVTATTASNRLRRNLLLQPELLGDVAPLDLKLESLKVDLRRGLVLSNSRVSGFGFRV